MRAPRGPPPTGGSDLKVEKAEVKVDRIGDPLPDGALLRLGTSRFRHPGNASAAGSSPDGRLRSEGREGRSEGGPDRRPAPGRGAVAPRHVAVPPPGECERRGVLPGREAQI